MSNREKVFDYIKDNLIAWKPKTTSNDIQGVGFNDKNVMDIASRSLPNTLEFDYVYVSPPIERVRAVTTGSKGRRATETYTIEIYTLRLGQLGDDTKIKTQRGANENYDFIETLLIRQGFTVVRTLTDLSYNNGDIARFVIAATKHFIKT